MSVSGFYAWRTRPSSERAIRHTWLTDQIIEVDATSRGTYGSRRVHAELARGRGLDVGYHQVTLLMAQPGFRACPAAGDAGRPPAGHRVGSGGPELRPPRT